MSQHLIAMLEYMKEHRVNAYLVHDLAELYPFTDGQLVDVLNDMTESNNMYRQYVAAMLIGRRAMQQGDPLSYIETIAQDVKPATRSLLRYWYVKVGDTL